jgi:hypothetical protein
MLYYTILYYIILYYIILYYIILLLIILVIVIHDIYYPTLFTAIILPFHVFTQTLSARGLHFLCDKLFFVFMTSLGFTKMPICMLLSLASMLLFNMFCNVVF